MGKLAWVMVWVVACPLLRAADDAGEPGADGPVDPTYAAEPWEGRHNDLYQREIELVYTRPTRVWFAWQTAVVPNMKHPPIVRVRLYQQLDSGKWRVMGTVLQVHNDDKGKTPVMKLAPGRYKLDIYVKRMAWRVGAMYPEGDPFSPPREAEAGPVPPADDAKEDDTAGADDATEGDEDTPLLLEDDPEPAPATQPEAKADDGPGDDGVDGGDAGAPADAPPDDAHLWEQLVTAGSETTTSDRVYHSFTLDRPAVVRFTWKSEPMGRPVFRVTLAAWNENLNKFTNLGVVVNTQARAAASAQKRLPADRYRVEVSANRTAWELTIEERLPDPPEAPAGAPPDSPPDSPPDAPPDAPDAAGK